MVTSGEQVDFIMENVYDPMTLKDELELRLFGEVAEKKSMRAKRKPAALDPVFRVSLLSMWPTN